eukprot:CAMPEP_0206543176 /NCGR_PEP_ID=MMETSP0325_2-20121206/10672_1 /ASSEMBLY_ACC=CAM_ASM_000347 /TAXON_ID=2866 /ORGANISM="Crypthecodinium cohnii, Strain Seligo" /LENGTH=36 /DNA_ID= /DNA_START= /DNA_END= /DNA_ORIENTATION=
MRRTTVRARVVTLDHLAQFLNVAVVAFVAAIHGQRE